MKNNICSILVLSRDVSVKQAYLTSLFIEKYWPDCPYEKFLCTQNLAPNDNKYDEVIYTDDKMIWGERLETALKCIDSEYVLLCPEDDFLNAKVDSEEFTRCIEYCKSNNVGALRVCPPMLVSDRFDEEYSIIPKEAVYRLVLHPMLFNTNYLRRFASLKYNPWQFERLGSKQSSEYDELILCTRKPVYSSVHAWSKGMWTRDGYAFLKTEKVPSKLYDFAKVYPLYLELVDLLKILLIKIFPKSIQALQSKRKKLDQKKLKL